MSISKLELMLRLLVFIGVIGSCADCSPLPASTSTVSLAQPTASPAQPTALRPSPTIIAPTSERTAVPDARQPWSQWPIIVNESFHDNRKHWFVGKRDNEFATFAASVGPNVYQFDIQSKQGVIEVSPLDTMLVGIQPGFYLAVDAKKVKGTDAQSYGLAFLYTPDQGHQHYFFALRDHEFRLTVRAKGVWHTIIDWTRSPLIQPNTVNRLGVFAQGNTFTFFINNTYVDEIEDTTLRAGRVGVGAEVFHADDMGVYEFDNLEVRTP